MSTNGSRARDVITVDSAPHLACADLIAALGRHGIVGTLLGDDLATDRPARLRLQIGERVDDVARSIRRALEEAIAARMLPLVAQQVGSDRFVVRPPAG
jgi:hypothetical protein